MILLLFLLLAFSVLYSALHIVEWTPLHRRLHPAAWKRLRWSAALGALLPLVILSAGAANRNSLPPPAGAGLLVGESLALLPPWKDLEPFPALETREEPDVHWLIYFYSKHYGVDPLLVLALIQEESQFDPRAVSPKGGMGLMQITKETADHLGLRNPFDVQENIEGGIRYLQTLLERYNWDLRLALASYNAGPSKVERYGGIPPYPETQRFIHKVTARYKSLQRTAEAFRHWNRERPASALLALASPEEEEHAGAQGRPRAAPRGPSREGGL